MNKSFITESADELFDKAERDIMSVDILLTELKYPEDRKYDIICFHATQAVEKFLKGYIISNGKNARKIHDLDSLQKSAMELDITFSKIMDNCLLLNSFVPKVWG